MYKNEEFYNALYFPLDVPYKVWEYGILEIVWTSVQINLNSCPMYATS